jgi:hypothetical protein
VRVVELLEEEEGWEKDCWRREVGMWTSRNEDEGAEDFSPGAIGPPKLMSAAAMDPSRMENSSQERKVRSAAK